MNILRFFFVILICKAAVAWADDSPPVMHGYPYTDQPYNALLQGQWNGIDTLNSQTLTISGSNMVFSGCEPIPYSLVRDQVRVDRDYPGPDSPHSESYRDIVITPRYMPPCVPTAFQEQPVVRFRFTRADLCEAILTTYRSVFDMNADHTNIDQMGGMRNGLNSTCPLVVR